MITVESALQHIKNNALDFGEVQLPLSECLGRIVAETLKSDRPIPPYNRVTMDGIAIAFEAYKSSDHAFKIEGIAAAGMPQMTLQQKENCLEVMTGAVLPTGTDTVIRYEDLDIENGIAKILDVEINKGKNIHIKGSDIAKDSLLIHPGTQIRSAEIGIAASIGKHELLVKCLPKTIIISTGDELVQIHETPEPHQIRRSNNATITALLSSWGIVAAQLHLPDDKDLILKEMNRVLNENDLVILSGGVSKGKFDYIPEAMKELGVEEVFHKIKQRPGKPFWFGRKDKTVVFGLPGNPVSSFVCTRKYIFNWLQHSLIKKEASKHNATLAEDFIFNPDLHLFLPVHTYTDAQGKNMAAPFPGNGSGDFVNLKNANALIELPKGKNEFKAGEVYPILLFESL